jgi:hypothetical protein
VASSLAGNLAMSIWQAVSKCGLINESWRNVEMLLIRNGETPAVGIWLKYLKHIIETNGNGSIETLSNENIESGEK